MSAAPAFELLPAGQAAWLVELPDLASVSHLHRALLAAPLDGVCELIPAARTLLVAFDTLRVSAPAMRQALIERAHAAFASSAGDDASPNSNPDDIVQIPVRYDGEDLAEVAATLGLTVQQVIERHSSGQWLAAFGGFAPGFVYLTRATDSDPCLSLHIPRRASPRTRVPAGSVAIAGEFSAVYPRQSPGGWQLLGTTPVAMWDLDRSPPAWVRPGQRVQFVPIAVDAFTSLGTAPSSSSSSAPSPSSSDDQSAAIVHLAQTGLQTLIQDTGRPHQAALGVSPSGALDAAAMRAANRAVGNPTNTPVLENLMGGLHLHCQRGSLTVAIAGAAVPLQLRDHEGHIHPLPPLLPHALPHAHTIALDAGDTLMLGTPSAGLRCYVAARGGWSVPQTLGSASTDTLAELGPAPLQRGQHLYAGRAIASHALQAVEAQPTPVLSPSEPATLPRVGDVVALRIHLGPRHDWFTPAALELLTGQSWQVSPQSSRVGMRLVGQEPLQRSRSEELPSEGVVTGSIQVPANGQPVLFLADHPVTGGYPVIAVLDAADLDRAAQIPPGAFVRFELSQPQP